MKTFISKLLKSVFFCSLFFLNSIAGFSTHKWDIIPDSHIGQIADYTEMNNDLYLISWLGMGTTNTGITTMNYKVFRFNGFSYTEIVAFETVSNGWNLQIQAYKNKLYIGGDFTSVNGDTTMNYLMQLQGTTLSQVGNGISETVNGSIEDLAIFNDQLLISGRFKLKDKTYIDYRCDFIMTWNNSQWNSLSTDEFSNSCYLVCFVRQMIVQGDSICIKGEFESIGNKSIKNIAVFKNGNWTGMGLNFCTVNDGQVLTQSNQTLYVFKDSVFFNQQGNYYKTDYMFKKWTANGWQNVSDTVHQTPMGTINFNGTLYTCLSDQYHGIPSVYTFNENEKGFDTNGELYLNGNLYTGIYFAPCKFIPYNGNLYCVNTYGAYDDFSSMAVLRTDQTTAVSNAVEKNNHAMAYPNPTTEKITVQRSIGLTEEITVSILDLNGRELLTTTFKGFEYELDLSTLPSGFYLLKTGSTDYQKIEKK
jgi:hypothetical protein